MQTTEQQAATCGDEPIDWAEEFAQHGGWLRSVIHARCREPQAVDEVFQDVALAAIRQQAPIADRTKLGPWLYQLAVRHCLMYRRAQGRRRRLLARLRREVENHGQTAPDPVGWLMSAERDRLVQRALTRLATREAEILLLKYQQQWSYQQMAEHLGISEAAVESRLHRARQRLRTILTETGSATGSP